jgi:peptidyl-tRNA hydrolase
MASDSLKTEDLRMLAVFRVDYPIWPRKMANYACEAVLGAMMEARKDSPALARAYELGWYDIGRYRVDVLYAENLDTFQTLKDMALAEGVPFSFVTARLAVNAVVTRPAAMGLGPVTKAQYNAIRRHTKLPV